MLFSITFTEINLPTSGINEYATTPNLFFYSVITYNYEEINIAIFRMVSTNM